MDKETAFCFLRNYIVTPPIDLVFDESATKNYGIRGGKHWLFYNFKIPSITKYALVISPDHFLEYTNKRSLAWFLYSKSNWFSVEEPIDLDYVIKHITENVKFKK